MVGVSGRRKATGGQRGKGEHQAPAPAHPAAGALTASADTEDTPPPPEDVTAAVSPAGVTGADSPVDAFDRLYDAYAGPVAQQAFLLCGDRQTAARAVEYAFRVAWDQWPRVAVDRDPAGWVRAAAYEYALSPWHRLRPGGGRGGARPVAGAGTEQDRALLRGLLELPPGYRRCVLLHDGLGLGLAETAAEAEASTAATAARITRAHEALADHLPPLTEVPPAERGGLLAGMLEQLAETQPVRPLPARRVRECGERLARRRIQAVVAVLALLAAAMLATALGR